MNEASKRKERKSFAVTEEIKQKIDEMIKQSGKEPGDFFEDLVTNLSLETLTEDVKKVAPAIQQHFESDLSRLGNAMNTIQLIFEGQMRNIVNEKEIWERKTSELQNTILDQVQKMKELEGRIQAEQETTQQLLDQNAALQEAALKYKDAIEETTKEHQKKLDEMAKSKEEIMEALRGQLETEKNRLNDLQTALEELLRESQVNKEKAKEVENLQQTVIGLQNDLTGKETEHQKELVKREKKVRDEYAVELKQYREDIRELTKIAEAVRKERDTLKQSLETRVETLRGDNSILLNQKEALEKEKQELLARIATLENL